MKQSQRFPEEKKIYKLKEGDKYLSYHILKSIIQDTSVPKKVIEEKNSELFYETLTGTGRIIFSNSLKYYGPVKNGLLETGSDKEYDPVNKNKNKDLCIILFPDGTKYEGEIHSNRITGKGKYYFPSGAKYTGSLLNGLRDGYGKYFSPEGITYEGGWKEGLKEGKGEMKSESMVYNGDWKKGNIDGKGKIKWENGNMYEGQFKENNMNGYGYMIWHNLLEKYIGKWQKNKQNGNGIHIWYEPSGELKEMRIRYVGQWHEGARNGYGAFFYSSGAKYEGYWKNNLKNGFGVMTYEDGNKYIGRFEDDRLIDKNNQLTEEQIIKINEENSKEKSTKDNNKSQPKKKVVKSRRASLKNMNSIKNTEEPSENNKETSSNLKNINRISSGESQKLNMLLNKQKAANKILFKFIPIFDLSDIEINYPEISADIEEITKVLLRNLSGIHKLYNYINKISKLEIINEETGKPNMILSDEQVNALENKLFSRKNSRNLSLSKNSLKVSSKKSTNKKAISSLIQINTNLHKIEEQLRSDDINFCFQIKDFWMYARECGLFNEKVTFAEFDRIFNTGKNNLYESFQIPKNLSKDDDIYNYIDKMVEQSKSGFIYKYKNYINYYYKSEEQKKEFNDIKINNNYEIINSIHDERRLILPRLFYECLIRLAFLEYNKSDNYEERNMKLSKKLEKILDIIIPPRMKKKQMMNMKSINQSKLEQSFNNSMNMIEANIARITETRAIEEFNYLFIKELKYLFDKVYEIYREKNNINFSKKNDRTITHLFFYRNIISTSTFFRQEIPNVITYIEIISNFLVTKSTFLDNLKKMKKSDYFDTINDILLKEMTEWEFYEIIFLLSKKYIITNNKKLNEKDLKYFLDNIKENVDKIIRSKKLRKKYFYPKLKTHEMKEQLIEEERKRKEEERRIKMERERFLKERENFAKEDFNAYTENYPEEEEDFEDSEEIFN